MRLLATLLLWSSVAGAACAPAGKLCTPDGVASNNPVCCVGLMCPSLGPLKDHCITVAPTPGPVTTTIVPSPRPTTSTTPPGPGSFRPVRYDATDVGLRFPDSQEVLWEPRTGAPANQYEALVRLSTIHWVKMPELLRLMRDTPACGVTEGTSQTVSDMVGKFFILYSLRPMRAGGPYQFHPNYLWDLPQGIFRRAAQCLRGTAVPLSLAPLLVTFPPPPTHHVEADRSHMLDGLLNPRRRRAPLTSEQCRLLHAAHAAHQQHAQALLDHDPQADRLAPAVGATQLAVEATARDPFEQSLLTLIFTPAIDPKRSQESVDALTLETMEFHAAWMDCLGCDTGASPDLTCAWGMALGHARAHFLRAVELPGLKLRTVCPLYIGNCPETGS